MNNKVTRFLRRPRAHVRYWAWLALRWLDGTYTRVPDGIHREQRWWDKMDYSYERYDPWKGWAPMHPRAHWFVQRILRRYIGKIRGPYSHRSDFTDREHGILHGARGWSEQAFNTFLARIDDEFCDLCEEMLSDDPGAECTEMERHAPIREAMELVR